MNNFIKIIGLVSLICFSFFYTEKVITVVNEQDEIMIKLNDVKDNYKVSCVDAIIDDDTIIPGIKGKEVDVEKSYKEMKEVGQFSQMLFVYKPIELVNSLDNNYDKYIINGNQYKKEVSLVVVVDNDYDVELIKNINDVSVNIFVDYNVLSSNLNVFKKNNFSVYSYGDKGKYSDDILMYSNNLINNNYNTGLYCLVKDKDSEVIEVCSNNRLHTILPSLIISNDLYNKIKNNLSNGLIILFNLNNKNISELKIVSDFINSKGYKIVSLEKLLKED